MPTRPTLVGFVLVFAALAGAATANAQIVVTDLGTPGTVSNAGAVNAMAQIVGNRNNPVAPFQRATLWQEGVASDVGSLCATCNSAALDINDAGDIVGIAFLPTFQSRGFLKRQGVLTELPPLLGHVRSIAHSINEAGEIVGQSTAATGESRPVRWLNGVPEDLGVLGAAGLAAGTAWAINDAGHITGESSTADGTLHAFLWRNGNMVDLGAASGGACASRSHGVGLNEDDQVVGIATIDCTSRPVTWVNGVMQVLAPLDPAIPAGSARNINEAGDIVGYSGVLSGGTARAVMWRAGQVIPLGSLAGPDGFSLAGDINDAGLIVGQSRIALGPSALHAVTFALPSTNTAPTISVPASLSVDATGIDGAFVTYSASGDDEQDGALEAACTTPSGALFAIGTTTVTCTVTDSGGLEASGSFTVTVRGAAAQLSNLQARVTGVGPGKSLHNKIAAAATAVNAGDTGQACSILHAFINEVAAQAEKKLTASQAEGLTAAAQRIRAIIGC